MPGFFTDAGVKGSSALLDTVKRETQSAKAERRAKSYFIGVRTYEETCRRFSSQSYYRICSTGEFCHLRCKSMETNAAHQNQSRHAEFDRIHNRTARPTSMMNDVSSLRSPFRV